MKRLYDTRAWRSLRLCQLSIEPLCSFCLLKGIVTPADEVDHIIPHHNDPKLFFDQNNLQSICHQCHVTTKALIDHGLNPVSYGEDGWPVRMDAKGLNKESYSITDHRILLEQCSSLSHFIASKLFIDWLVFSCSKIIAHQ